MHNMTFHLRRLVLAAGVALAACTNPSAGEFDKETVSDATGIEATRSDEVIRVGWTRDDIDVTVDGMAFPPAAGLGSWAAFRRADDGDAVVTGDTVVFQDEVDAAMDAAFAHDLRVTALHNHFFFDEPKAYFMHIAGRGGLTDLATGVRAVWDAIKAVRAQRERPATGFGGPTPDPGGGIDEERIAEITGLQPAEKPGGVVKISTGRTVSLDDTPVGPASGVSSWAAFSGSNELAAMDGDIVMTAEQVQPVLKTLRKHDVHVVALHNHMTTERPVLYFTHFWAKGPVDELATAFRNTLDAAETARGSGG